MLQCPNCFASNITTPCPHCGWTTGLDNPPPALALGTLLDGRYRIGRVLGHGGFGITYLAWDENLHLRLAIKEYLPRDSATRAPDGVSLAVYSGSATEQFSYGLERFLEEARALARFDQHPGIVTVKSFFRAHGTGYSVMEFVEGLTLKQYLAQQPGERVPFDQALTLLMPVMDALRAVHKGGLLHRDIAPDNIYLSHDGRVKLLDFGAARFAASEHSRSLSVILKPGYAPEEQYRARGRQGAWTDIYSLAATLYRTITGQVPPEALDRLDADELVPPSQLGAIITPEQEAVLVRALAVRAAERFESVEALQQAWKSPVATRLPPPASRQALTQDELSLTLEPPPAQRPALIQADAGRPSGAPPAIQPKPTSPWNVLAIIGLLGLLLLMLAWLLSNAEFTKIEPPEESLSATEPSDAESQFKLGLKYANGEGISQDDAMAVYWYRKAAEQSNLDAQAHLGLMYYSGRGVVKDDRQAAQWFRKAAEQGHAAAQFSLGVMYENGLGMVKDDLQAVQWYRLAAEQGHAAAKYNLGVMYENGRGVVKDDREAVHWYIPAAELGVDAAQYNLGVMYANGRGVIQNDRHAVHWFRQAAEQGHAEAQVMLGLKYVLGKGVTQNTNQARQWFEKAAVQGNDDAQKLLDALNNQD